MSRVLELDRVSRAYAGSQGAKALNECSLQVESGDFLTVVGPSGSGKSTLLNIVGLLDSPTSGAYRLLGEDTSAMGETGRSRMRGRTIGFVFQSFQLLEQRTCLDNVMLADLYRGAGTRESRFRAREALESVGLGNRATSLPTEMSGGQRQRVAIARALMGKPALLLCDEPTGNLDSRTAESILQLFADLNEQGSTIMLITHDPGIAARGNRTISLLDGVASESSRGEGS